MQAIIDLTDHRGNLFGISAFLIAGYGTDDTGAFYVEVFISRMKTVRYEVKQAPPQIQQLMQAVAGEADDIQEEEAENDGS